MKINKDLIKNLISFLKNKWKWILFLFIVFMFTLMSIIFLSVGYSISNLDNNLLVKQTKDTYISIGFSFFIVSLILIISLILIFMSDLIYYIKLKKSRK